MKLALIAALLILMCAVVTLATCIQVLYLESMRLRTREFASLEYFKSTIESRIGLDVDGGALTFSLIKHIGLAGIGCLAVMLAYGSDRIGMDWEAIVVAIIMAASYAVVGTFIIPQLVYRKSSGVVLGALVPFYRALALAMRPLTWLLGFLQSLFDLDTPSPSEEAPSPVEHIDALITAGEEEGIIEKGDRELIQSVVAFGDKTVREVMTPRPRVVAIRKDASLDELRELVIDEQFSRIPAFEETIDQIVGFVHVRDMFELDEAERKLKKAGDIMRPIRAVPETKKVNDLLREMQEEGAHMAVVIDEYGATAGIVTMEDMVEEIVGEIHDEHEPERDFRREPDGSYVVSGSFDVSRLIDLVSFHTQADTESTTVGGLVTEWLGHVPAPGEVAEREGISIQVLSANHVRVKQVRVSRVAPA